jgi:tetratricopeptide (TPR) repeat protein
VDAHLLDEPTAGRYRLHDLLKEYAIRLVSAAEPEPERRAATERLLDFYLHSAAAASRALETDGIQFNYQLDSPPQLARLQYTTNASNAWFAVERTTLTAAIQCAVAGGWHGHAWRLARATWRYLYANGYHDDCTATMSLVLTTAEGTGDRRVLGLARNYLAASDFHRGRWEDSLKHVDRAIDLRAEDGDIEGLVASLKNRTQVLVRGGRYAEAKQTGERALKITMQANVSRALTGSLELALGVTHACLGDIDAAEYWFQRQVAQAEKHGPEAALGAACAHLGGLELRRGRFADALGLLERASHLWITGNPSLLAETTCDIGSAHRGLGNLTQALNSQREALATMEKYGAVFGECDVRIELALTLYRVGEQDEATDHVRKALDIADRLNLQPQRAKALLTLATITNDEDLRRQAAAHYRKLGLPTPTLEG